MVAIHHHKAHPMIKRLFTLALPLISLAVCLPSTGEAKPTRNTAATGTAPKAAAIPENYLPTPFGFYVSDKCYIRLEADEEIVGTQIYSAKHNAYKDVQQCEHPAYNRDGTLYIPHADFINTASGNHDLIVYGRAPAANVINNAAFFLHRSNLAAPATIKDQTLYYATGATGSFDGIYSFFGWNIPHHPKQWAYGMMLPSLKGNVIAKTGAYADASRLSPLVSGGRRLQDPYTYLSYITATPDTKLLNTNYISKPNLTMGTAFSLQTFGVTSCDMLPGTGEADGTFEIEFVNSGGINDYITEFENYSSDLCNMKVTRINRSRGFNYHNSFVLSYDKATAKGRSAIITYTTK